MSTFDILKELHGEETVLDVLLFIESGDYYKACSLIRSPGQNIFSAAKSVQKLAKEELNVDIMPYLSKY